MCLVLLSSTKSRFSFIHSHSSLPRSSLRSTPLLRSTCRAMSTLWTFCRRLMAGRRSLDDKLQSWVRSSITRLQQRPTFKAILRFCTILGVKEKEKKIPHGQIKSAFDPQTTALHQTSCWEVPPQSEHSPPPQLAEAELSLWAGELRVSH